MTPSPVRGRALQFGLRHLPKPLASRLHSDLLLGLGLRGAGAISSFALTWIMAQMFGAKIIGLYQIAFTTMTLLAGMAALGQPVIMVRQLPTLLQASRLAEAGGRFRGSFRFVAVLGIALALLAAAISLPMATLLIGDSGLAPFIIAIAPAVLLLPLVRLQCALLRCHGQVRLSQSLEGVGYTTFAMLVMLGLWQSGGTYNPLIAPAALVTGLTLSLATGAYFARKSLGEEGRSAPTARPEIAAGAWVATAPLVTLAGNWLILLTIGAMLGAADAGVFRTAVQICMLMELINTSFATMAGPHLARAAGSGDTARLRRIILVAGGIGIALASPLGLLAIIAPEWLLGLFGPEFVSGAEALRWIAVGQLVNVAAGPVGVALIMQKRERTVLLVEIGATTCGLLTVFALIPQWGLMGASLGVLLAVAIRNLTNAALVWMAKADPKAEA